MIRLAYLWIVVFVIGAVTSEREARAGHEEFRPDFGLMIVCAGIDVPTVEDGFESFFKLRGFRILNRREYRAAVETHIVGMHRDQGIIKLSSFAAVPDEYWFALNTPPPTHYPDLENALLRFVSNELGCQTRVILREGHKNIDSAQLYDKNAKRMEKLFLQAERFRNERRL